MIGRISQIASYIVVALGAWWLWTGPINDMRTVTFEEQMELNEEQMQRCLRSKEYVAGATGNSVVEPEAQCAKKYRLYLHEGRWYSHDQPRPASG